MNSNWGGLKALLFVLMASGVIVGCEGVDEETEMESRIERAMESPFDTDQNGLVSMPGCQQMRPPSQLLPGARINPCMKWVHIYWNDPARTELVAQDPIICNPCRGPGDRDSNNPDDHQLNFGGIPQGSYLFFEVDLPDTTPGTKSVGAVFFAQTISGATYTMSGGNSFSVTIPPPPASQPWAVKLLVPHSWYDSRSSDTADATPDRLPMRVAVGRP